MRSGPTGPWTRVDTIWTDGSRLDNREMGAACVWRIPSGWAGHRFHLGLNKGDFDAEFYAIYQALSIMGQRQESRRWYTLFVDSASAISRACTDDIGPGQRFAVASIEVATRLLTRDNEVTIR